MVNVNKLKSDARKLIDRGCAEFEARFATGSRTKRVVTKKNLRTGEVTKSQVKGSPVHRDEYWLKYEKARDLLLKHACEKELNPQIQSLYFELIPDSEEFAQEKQTSFKRIRSRSGATRLKAAKHFSKQARAETSRYRAAWLKHPETVATLIEALQKEESSKVACELIVALGSIYDRYFHDLRIFPVLFRFYDSEDKSLQHAAVLWTSRFPNREKWPRLVALLESKTSQAFLIPLLRHVRPDISVKLKRRLQPLLLNLANRKLNVEARDELMGAMINTVDARTVASFRDQIKDAKRIKSALAKWVDVSTSGERRQFLHSKLLT